MSDIYFYVVGNRSNDDILETGSRNSSLPLAAVFAANYEVAESDVVIFTTTNPATLNRITKGDEYTVTWAGAGGSRNIVGLDFAVEDAKFYYEVQAAGLPSLEQRGNGGTPTDITVTIRRQSDDQIQTVNGFRTLPVERPDGTVIDLKCSFSGGIAIIPFATTRMGVWKIPASFVRLGGFRFEPAGQLTITVFSREADLGDSM